MSAHSNDDRTAMAVRLPRDFVVGLFVLAFCAVAYWVTLGFEKAPAAVAQNVQPATFPRLVIAVVVVLTLAMMALSFAKDSRPADRVPLMVPLSAALMLAFVVAFQALGIVVTMILFCLAMPVLWGERRWLRVAAFAALFPAAIYAVFVVGLGVHFDPGPLGF